MKQKKKVVSSEVQRTKQMRRELSFGEKVEDIWYQYKWFILLGVFCVIVAAVCIGEFVNREHYDYKLVFITDEEYSYQQTDYISDCILSFGNDLDGDGEIDSDTTVLSYSMMEYDPTSYSSLSILVDTKINRNEAFLFVMDEYSYDKYCENFKTLFSADGTKRPIGEAGVKLSETNLALYAKSAELADDLYIFLRYYDSSLAEAAAPYAELYNNIINVQ